MENLDEKNMASGSTKESNRNQTKNEKKNRDETSKSNRNHLAFQEGGEISEEEMQREEEGEESRCRAVRALVSSLAK